ncbi:MAG TPA: hypothetical protein PKM73_05445 [Verrucomicrobiota bacterium]|nr:hypothetical protein [Verrucomicrobiota bacterium]HNU51324.1 hypothetical protein [Verrucomicrobiota bacterium]
MKTNSVLGKGSLFRVLALAATLGITLSDVVSAGDLVPYQGVVEGQIVNSEGTVTGEAIQVASHLGKGVQQYDGGEISFDDPSFDITLTKGAALSVAANGDVLLLEYSLYGYFVSLTEIVYEGTYTIQPGGTGRFDFPSGVDLGTGEIVGRATVDGDTGVLSFEHTFEGTLYSVGAGRGSKK